MRTTAPSRRSLGRLLVGAAVAAIVAVEALTGVAVAAQPASLTSAAVVGAALQPQPPAGPAASKPPASPTSSAASRTRAGDQQRARARAKAVKRAAQLAEAGRRAQASWEARGRPNTMIVVRPDTVDLVAEGHLTRRLSRRPGDLTLTALHRYLPTSWLSITGGTAQLSAALVLTPHVTVDVGGEVTLLKLAGGTTLPEAASLYTGGGRIVLHGVTVTSADRTFQQPIPPAAGRPFIVVSPGGRLEATDATISDLGTPPNGQAAWAGIQFNTGSGGSLVRTSVLRNSTGLQLVGSQDVRLEDLTIGASTGDGLILHGDHGTTMRGIRAERNGGNGVRVTGEATGRAITGITASGNGRFGIAAVDLATTEISRVTTSDDGAGGLEVSRSHDLTVTDLTAVDEPIGVFTHIGSTNTLLDRLTITGGRRGLAVEKTTKHLTVQASTITRARVAGIAVGGTEVELREVSVHDSHTGVRVERGASGVTAVGLRLSGGQDGLVAAPGTTRLILHNLTAYGVRNDAVRTFSPDARILGGTITGATTGVTAGAQTTITGTSITLVNDGLRARSTGLVDVDDVDVHAIAVGIDVAPGSPVALTGSRVHALEAVRGRLTQQSDNDLSLPPLNLLGAIGIPFILLALVLELVHTVRRRRSGEGARRLAPPTLPTAPPMTRPPADAVSPTRSPATAHLGARLGAATHDAIAPG